MIKNKFKMICLPVFISFMMLINIAKPLFPNPTNTLNTTPNHYIIAHKGGQALNPGNTLEAVEYTKSQLGSKNVDIYYEVDIRITKDLVPVLFHDLYMGEGHPATPFGVYENTLVDCKGGNLSGSIRDFTWEQVSKCSVLPEFKKEYDNKKPRLENAEFLIPSLESLFETYKDDDSMKYLLDVKLYKSFGVPQKLIDEGIEKIGALVEKYDLWDRIIIGNLTDGENNQKMRDYFKTKYNQTPNFYSSKSEIIDWTVKSLLGVDFFFPNKFQVLSFINEFGSLRFTLLDSMLSNVAYKNRVVDFYWTVVDQKTMIEILHKGARGIIVDDPILLYDTLIKEGYIYEN